MVTGTRAQEREYRQLDALSQSMIKEFSDDRKKFHKKYILGEPVKEKPEQTVKMGNLADCLYLTPNQFEERFAMSICTDVPTGLMLKFVEALARLTEEATDEEGIMREQFATIAQKAHVESNFKWALGRVLENFHGKEAENYYRELVEESTSGRTIITAEDVENGNKIVTALRTGEFTKFLNDEGGKDTEVFHQLAISGFVVEGRPCKGLIDRLEVNHEKKYIQPWDLKITWSVEGFYTEYYLKRAGYLQASTYDLACVHLRNQEYAGYEVRPMKFIVCDTINYYSPLIYELTTQDIVDGWKGFTYRGRPYKGLIQLVQELNWHMDNNIWNMSMANYVNKGRVNLTALKQP